LTVRGDNFDARASRLSVQPRRSLRPHRPRDAWNSLNRIGYAIAVDIDRLVERIQRIAAQRDFEPICKLVFVQVRLKVDARSLGTGISLRALRTGVALRALGAARPGGPLTALNPLRALGPGGTGGALEALGAAQVDRIAPRTVRVAELQRRAHPRVRGRRPLRARNATGAGVSLRPLRTGRARIALNARGPGDPLRAGRADGARLALRTGDARGSRRAGGARDALRAGPAARLEEVRNAIPLGVEGHVDGIGWV